MASANTGESLGSRRRSWFLRESTGESFRLLRGTPCPAVLDIGIGSPTGVKFGESAGHFQILIRDAFFMEDWSVLWQAFGVAFHTQRRKLVMRQLNPYFAGCR